MDNRLAECCLRMVRGGWRSASQLTAVLLATGWTTTVCSRSISVGLCMFGDGCRRGLATGDGLLAVDNGWRKQATEGGAMAAARD